jgi:predicted metal-binding membrane protein
MEPGHPVRMMAPMTLTSFVGMWSAMTAAMMLPSAVPALVRGRGRGAVVAALEYVAVWIAVGLAGYGAYRLLPAIPWWSLVAVGLAYELTPVKRSALRHCRQPASSGFAHGAACVVCCAGLMLVVAGVGLMNIAWMAVIGIVVFVQKVGPRPAIRSQGVAAG